METKQCPACGEDNNASFNKCWKCGKDLTLPPDISKRTEEFVDREIKEKSRGRDEERTQSWFQDIKEPKFASFRKQMDVVILCLIIGLPAAFFIPVLFPPVAIMGIIGIIYLVYKYTRIKETPE